jgi:hypothetical protein
MGHTPRSGPVPLAVAGHAREPHPWCVKSVFARFRSSSERSRPQKYAPYLRICDTGIAAVTHPWCVKGACARSNRFSISRPCSTGTSNWISAWMSYPAGGCVVLGTCAATWQTRQGRAQANTGAVSEDATCIHPGSSQPAATECCCKALLG